MTARSRRRCASARRFEATARRRYFVSVLSRECDPCLDIGRFAGQRRSSCRSFPKPQGLMSPRFRDGRRDRAASLSIILALRRNPIEIWCKADFERPVSIGRSFLGLRGAAHDPAAVRRDLSRQRRQLPQGRSSASRVAAGSREWVADSRGRGLAHPAPRARALVFAPSDRGIRPGHAPGRVGRRSSAWPAGATAR